MPKLSGNKGEWSEIYAFLRLLEIKKLYAADSQLNKKDDMFYNIINIIRTEPVGKLEFRINRAEDTITVFNTDDNTELLTLPCSEFKNAADRLYCEIIETNASAFALPDTEEFLDTLNIGVLKAKSTDKADIRIKIHDINTGYETVQGFSIKSRLGSPSTLVNAGKTTNFVFEVTGNIDDTVAQEFNTCSKKFKDRFEVLAQNNCDISYHSMENDIFESNLQLLKKLGIVKTKNKGYKVFMEHIAPDFLDNTMIPSEYAKFCWKKYETSGVPRTNSLNGTIFELIIATLFVKEGLVPLHLQAQVAFVPNVNFDAILYTNETGPIGLSLKTSLRERYKQADLEAIALKYVHRKAENYLLTMDATEASMVSNKIKNGDVLGLNQAILTTSDEFDKFIDELKKKKFVSPGSVEIIKASITITSDDIAAACKK